ARTDPPRDRREQGPRVDAPRGSRPGPPSKGPPLLPGYEAAARARAGDHGGPAGHGARRAVQRSRRRVRPGDASDPAIVRRAGSHARHDEPSARGHRVLVRRGLSAPTGTRGVRDLTSGRSPCTSRYDATVQNLRRATYGPVAYAV